MTGTATVPVVLLVMLINANMGVDPVPAAIAVKLIRRGIHHSVNWLTTSPG